MEKYLVNNKIVENCFENDNDIFKELKKCRKTNIEVSETIDGKNGKDIPDEFANVYEELFNRIDDSQEINDIFKNLKIDEHSRKEVEKIDSCLIKQALTSTDTVQSGAQLR